MMGILGIVVQVNGATTVVDSHIDRVRGEMTWQTIGSSARNFAIMIGDVYPSGKRHHFAEFLVPFGDANVFVVREFQVPTQVPRVWCDPNDVKRMGFLT